MEMLVRTSVQPPSLLSSQGEKVSRVEVSDRMQCLFAVKTSLCSLAKITK